MCSSRDRTCPSMACVLNATASPCCFCSVRIPLTSVAILICDPCSPVTLSAIPSTQPKTTFMPWPSVCVRTWSVCSSECSAELASSHRSVVSRSAFCSMRAVNASYRSAVSRACDSSSCLSNSRSVWSSLSLSMRMRDEDSVRTRSTISLLSSRRGTFCNHSRSSAMSACVDLVSISISSSDTRSPCSLRLSSCCPSRWNATTCNSSTAAAARAAMAAVSVWTSSKLRIISSFCAFCCIRSSSRRMWPQCISCASRWTAKRSCTSSLKTCASFLVRSERLVMTAACSLSARSRAS
mmetsp:Transcript_18380/g.42099  ORF Transcript_18380/g.42099 Transcript_18380/m.42099 type:complete len:295 (-) Transcript_18380:642-1526(-)